jgi:hypothetical protein
MGAGYHWNSIPGKDNGMGTHGEQTRIVAVEIPKEAFEFGMKNHNMLNRGRMEAPSGPGLGVNTNLSPLDSRVIPSH